jgi:hypothetical protein
MQSPDQLNTQPPPPPPPPSGPPAMTVVGLLLGFWIVGNQLLNAHHLEHCARVPIEHARELGCSTIQEQRTARLNSQWEALIRSLRGVTTWGGL